jgi:outer membrane protein OmpA-like peptidoglycan-associated protein
MAARFPSLPAARLERLRPTHPENPMPRRPIATALLAAALSALLAACATAPTGEPARPLPSARPAAPAQDKAKLVPARLDAVQADLALRLGSLHLELIRSAAEELTVRIPAAAAFPADEVSMHPSLRATLDRFAEAFAAHPDMELIVVGHTDSIGRELYNMDLSIRRAEAVMAYLAGRGLPAGRIIAQGRGETQPIADNATEAGRASNRRVELLIRPAPER